jgi:hypothetical protein
MALAQRLALMLRPKMARAVEDGRSRMLGDPACGDHSYWGPAGQKLRPRLLGLVSHSDSPARLSLKDAEYSSKREAVPRSSSCGPSPG